VVCFMMNGSEEGLDKKWECSVRCTTDVYSCEMNYFGLLNIVKTNALAKLNKPMQRKR
jgi:hypothetical protein